MSTANDLLVDGFSRISVSVPSVLDGLDADRAAWRPSPDANSISWLVWHLTRVLDDHCAGVFGVDQVWPTMAVASGIDLPVDNIGYGNSSEQVGAVHPAPQVLIDYFTAVWTRFRPSLETFDDWERIVDENYAPPVTAAVRLVSVLDDCARHIGQAEYVRGLLTD